MGSLVSKITDTLGLTDSTAGQKAYEAGIQGAQISADAQREALDYLKQTEELPLELRDRFLPQLADIFTGGEGQQEFIDSARASPLYEAILGGREAGEQAILRNASATGGLRSGNVSGALTDYGSQLENRALLESYNQQLQGISGLANMPLNTNAIADTTAGIGQTLGQGLVGATQAQLQGDQANRQNVVNLLGGVASGLGGYAAFSDIRFKSNITPAGRRNGHNWYRWWWNELAKKLLGLEGVEEGVMAHEVYETNPEAVGTIDGYLVVNKTMLGVQ